MLRIVAERADHLARLVEDLLLASRISSEPGGSAVVGMRRECTDLAEAARRAAADWRLGLFIARELVRAMGGEIEATGAPRPGLDLHRPPALGPAARQPLCRCF